MSALTTLLRHEAREARTALIAAPVLTLAVLGVLHTPLARAGSLANATSEAVAILVTLWTAYFAADLFASDCASGRLRTKALLPIEASTIWRAKLAFLALVTIGLAAMTIASAILMHRLLATDRSLEQLTATMLSMRSYVAFLPLIAASAVVCSLVVESALAAFLLSLIVDACVVGLAVLWARAWSSVGVTWSGNDQVAGAVVVALLLFALGAFAFRRGERRFGTIRVRVRIVASVVAGVLVLGGVGTATEVWRRLHVEIDSSRTSCQAASSSPDGRYLAVELWMGSRHGAADRYSVWLIDLETKHRELAASAAMLLRDRVTWQPMPWDGARLLRVENHDATDVDDAIMSIRIEGKTRIEPRPWVPHPCLVPDWAEWSYGEQNASQSRALTIRWNERDIERTFVGDSTKAWLGRTVFVSPRAGWILRLEDGALRRIDLGDGSEHVLVPSDVQRVDPSPDGSAVLVQSPDGIRAFSTVDDAELHALWPKGTVDAQWVSGSSRVVRLVEFGRGGREFLLDLDAGVEFEIHTNRNHGLIHRLPGGGYVYVDAADDLVRVDARGELVAVLVDR